MAGLFSSMSDGFLYLFAAQTTLALLLEHSFIWLRIKSLLLMLQLYCNKFQIVYNFYLALESKLYFSMYLIHPFNLSGVDISGCGYNGRIGKAA
ncbi:hypothetical protein Leryth_023024, partial [Lithospermum erythrorhizon]